MNNINLYPYIKTRAIRAWLLHYRTNMKAIIFLIVMLVLIILASTQEYRTLLIIK